MYILDEEQPFTKGKSYAWSKVRNRKRVTKEVGATESEFWEQYQEPGGVIDAHFHDTEETIVFLNGQLQVRMGTEEQLDVVAPATLFIPQGVVHRIENVGEEDAHLMAFFGKAAPKSTYTEPLDKS